MLWKTPGPIVGELDKQAEAEATETAQKVWRMKDGEWKMKTRLVGGKYKRAEHREDLFLLGGDSFLLVA